MSVSAVPLRFTQADAERAHDAWGANCGPAAIAAVLGMTLDELRPHLGDFERRRYTTPSLMWAVLDGLRVPYDRFAPVDDWPDVLGIVRIQWEGPWMRAGVPKAARYRHTHWVGAHRDPDYGVRIFDVNAMAVGGWIGEDEWTERLVPWLIRECEPKGTGGWHRTHVLEVRR